MEESNPDPWTNLAIDVDALPDFRDLEFNGVAPTWPRYTLLTTVLGIVPTLGAAGVLGWWLGDEAPFGLRLALPAVPLVVGLWVGIWRWLDGRRRGWALRQHDVVARAGVLWRAVTVLPIARIQHVETSHGPIERRFRLARLKLFTAGGMTADLVLPGLGRGRADELREYLAEQIRLRDRSDAASEASD